MVQLSHPYTTTGKAITLTIHSFVEKVMSLLFNMLSRFVIAFLPRSKPLSISWLHSPSAVIWELKKIKSVTVSTFSPSICNEVMGLDAMKVKVTVSQSCPILCDTMDYTVHGILQARILEWVAIPSLGVLSNPGTEPRFPALQADSLPAEPPGKPGCRDLGFLNAEF